ncbi:hypothetical protein CP965_02680 [Halarcobacter mediterraneus]|uniref:EF-hand domain-containing protein n=1 Tax=Halarcobacter mediterraneus TaxID=2023153 RepID=A0A4Q1B1Y3_9BACT|nr:EF-hand domain-containing protein [Halarcobacter mediterraneus]RXK14371.1 hypothetical protein CP965_02680 [Halarcobacter mediterraneus]
MKKIKLITACLCFIGGVLLTAETLPVRGPILFSTYDKDNNNLISEKEFNSIKEERMTQKANSGRLMKNVGQSPAFSDLDLNNDGSINKEELQKHQEKRFNNRKMKGQGNRGF